jgi:hypothetical protein
MRPSARSNSVIATWAYKLVLKRQTVLFYHCVTRRCLLLVYELLGCKQSRLDPEFFFHFLLLAESAINLA